MHIPRQLGFKDLTFFLWLLALSTLTYYSTRHRHRPDGSVA